MPDSTFVYDWSPQLREGDFVRSHPLETTGSGSNNAKRGQKGGKGFSRLGGLASNASGGNNHGDPDAPENAVVDTSSVDALRASLAPSWWGVPEHQQRLQALPFMGRIERIIVPTVLQSQDSGKALARGKPKRRDPPPEPTAVVSIWRRGDEFFLSDRPRETYGFDRLAKVSKAEFEKECRRPYMRHKGHVLQLRGEGHDEDTPISLVAYNNKLINELFARTYQSASSAREKSALTGVDDPYRDLREEMRQLLGTDSAARRHRKRAMEQRRELAAATGTLTHAEREERTEAEFLRERSKMLGNPTGGGGTGGATAQGGAGKVARLIAGMANTTTAAISRSLNLRSEALSRQLQTDGSLLSAANTAGLDAITLPEREYVVEEVAEGGVLLLALADAPSAKYAPVPRLQAVLDCLEVPPTELAPRANPLKELRSMLLHTHIHCIVFGTDARGRARVTARQGDKWLHHELVQRGLARVATSLVDQLEELGYDERVSTPPPGLEVDEIRRLLVVQESALQARAGMWGSQGAASNFLLGTEESPFALAARLHSAASATSSAASSAGATPPAGFAGRSSAIFNDTEEPGTPLALAPSPIPLDTAHEQEMALPALFDCSFSSQEFRARLPNLRQRTLLPRASTTV
eukprot:TRINITY_DN11809_c0_g1_i1.p1 TRINITY_DN11809_c0_g1~~TRINITY_DN11809_c0_g1_i1.p1  ORF type:complete len:638 (-),score=118.69 TRINITY_DN11809_c0_g1_i1:249-2162(-)